MKFLKNLCFKFQMWWYSRGIPTANVNDEDVYVRDFLKGKTKVEVGEYTDVPEDDDWIHIGLRLNFPDEDKVDADAFKTFAIAVSNSIGELLVFLDMKNIALSRVDFEAEKLSKGDDDDGDSNHQPEKTVSVDVGRGDLTGLFVGPDWDVFDPDAVPKSTINIPEWRHGSGRFA